MQPIIVKTQAEYDALPPSFDEFTEIHIKTDASFWLVIKTTPKNSRVVAWESSSVVARGSSSVVARESSSVVAWGSSSVVAWGSSSVVAWESSSVVARESSRVEARGSSSVVAWGSSSVVAWESSRVEAWGSSRVEAWGSATVHMQSSTATALLYAFAVLFAHIKGKITKKSKTCTVIHPKTKIGADGWLEAHGIKPSVNVVLFKRVSADFKTQEGTGHETPWAIGATLEHPAWAPAANECRAGKFHACGLAYFCDEFRDKPDDRYIAIRVAKADLYAWPNGEYPHKIAFRKGKVLYECNRWGERINP